MYVYRNIVEAGLLTRCVFQTELRNLCFLRGLELKIEEDRGIFSSIFRFEISGEESKVREAMASLLKRVKQIT